MFVFWCDQICSKNGVLTNKILLRKATTFKDLFVIQFANDKKKAKKYRSFKISNGWLVKFKRRHNIVRYISLNFIPC
jgi:hypothetical protein